MKKDLGKNADGTWNGLVLFKFDGLATVTFDSQKVSAENEQNALAHGWLARIGDGAALSRKQKDGTVVTITEAMRRDEVLALVAHYESGTTEWNIKGGTRAAPQNPTILAIAAKMGCTYAEAEAEVARKMLAEME